MRHRYLTNLTLLLAGGFLVVTSMAFPASVFAWLMLAVGIATVILMVPAVAIRSRGLAQRGLDGTGCALGIWTIIASMVFAGTAVTWLGFASGIGLVALAVAGLTLHELSSEHVVHSLAPSTTGAREDDLVIAGA